METFIEPWCRAVFGWLCHQDPTILNVIDGKPIWLCPRCSGLQLGLLFSFLAARFLPVQVRLAGRASVLIFVVAAAAMMTDWFAGQFGFYSPSSSSRLLTGLAVGAAAGILLVLYRRGLAAISELKTRELRAPSALGLIAFAMMIGWMVVTQVGWWFQSVMLLTAVLANAGMVLHTVYLVLKFRFFRVVSSQSSRI